MQAAAELIVTEGLSASNMDNVRKAASVSGSQLAHYFADKSALIRAVIRRQIGVVLDFHRQPKLRGLDSFDDFERWIDLNMRYLRRIGYFGTPTYHALSRAAGEVRRRHARRVGRRLPAVDRAAGGGDRANERRRRSGCATPTRDSWRWSSSAPTREAARWPSPIERSGRTPMRFDSRSTTCACSPPTPPNERRARRAVRAGGVGATSQLTHLRRRWRRDRTTHSRFTRKGLATRARIVDVAARLMFERGVANTSIDAGTAAPPGWADRRSRTTSATSAT